MTRPEWGATGTIGARDGALAVVDGGITAAQGFVSAALHCGVKRGDALDLAVIAADRAVPAAGIFTTNLAQAAPVRLSRRHLVETGGHARAIVVNSGCANACTGAGGEADAARMAAETARALGCAPAEVLVASTGVIGVALPMDRVASGIGRAVAGLARGAGHETARAIMTTDTHPKACAVRAQSARGPFTVGGIAKGAGMIEPNMATMLAFLTTDAAVPPALLDAAVREAAFDTFNAITVDGECSTNDSVLVLASGASGIPIDQDSYPVFVSALRAVSLDLALGVVRGGEGATKLVAVRVHDGRSREEAQRVARTVANSLLVKTAVHGADPNWGRIVAAAGRSGVPFDIAQATVHVGGVLLFDRGVPHDEASPLAERHLTGADVRIEVGLGTGGGQEATVWTCDLSAEYVRINGEYRT